MKSRIQDVTVCPDRCCVLQQHGIEQGGRDMDRHPQHPPRRRALAQMSEGQGWQGEVSPRAGRPLASASTLCLDDGVLPA